MAGSCLAYFVPYLASPTAHFNLKAVFNTSRKATISPFELTRAGFFALPALASA